MASQQQYEPIGHYYVSSPSESEGVDDIDNNADLATGEGSAGLATAAGDEDPSFKAQCISFPTDQDFTPDQDFKSAAAGSGDPRFKDQSSEYPENAVDNSKSPTDDQEIGPTDQEIGTTTLTSTTSQHSHGDKRSASSSTQQQQHRDDSIPIAFANLVDDGLGQPHLPNKSQEQKAQIVSRWRIVVVIVLVVLVTFVAGLVGGICGSGKCFSSTTQKLPTVSDLAVLLDSTTGEIFGTTVMMEPVQIGPACMDPAPLSPQGFWYQIVGTGGVIQISTCSKFTNFPISIAVYHSQKNVSSNGKSEASASDFACETTPQPDATCEKSPQVAWLSTPGQTYYIFLQGVLGTTGGNFGLSITVSKALEFGVFNSHAYAVSPDSYFASTSLALVDSPTTTTFRVCGQVAHLTVITSAEENDFIHQLGQTRGGYLLLGGFQDPSVAETTPDDAARGWSWIDEGSFTAGNFTTADNEYSNWDTNQPDNLQSFENEDCLTLFTGNGKWHDRDCVLDAFPFVLEIDLTRESQSPDSCIAALNVDPLVTVAVRDDGTSYVCTYLSEAIDELVATSGSVESLMALLGSLPGSLTPEQMETIIACVEPMLT